MKDYTYERDNGQTVTVSDMTTEEIHAVMRDGYEMQPGCGATIDNVRDRLAIELLRREMGL